MTIENQADLIAEAVRATYNSMSPTDKALIQKAVLRAQRKAIAVQMAALSTKVSQ